MDLDETTRSFLLVRQLAGDNRDAQHEELLMVADGSPIAADVLAVCQEHCGNGDLVIGSLRLDGTTVRIMQTWPFGMPEASELTGADLVYAAGDAVNGDAAVKLRMRDFGRAGRVVWFKGVGPPAWRCPRVAMHRERGHIRVQAGWRFTAYQVGWISARQVALARHRRSISQEGASPEGSQG